VKHDVVPGQYETFWFEPTAIGEYALECSEFCGTQHANMIGKVIVQSPADYARWLVNQGVSSSLAQQGEALFRSHGCSGCHGANSTVHAPPLGGLYGSIVHLQDGRTLRADERYIRDCILEPLTQSGGGLSASDAVLRRPARRGRSGGARRLYPVAAARIHAMTAIAAESEPITWPRSRPSARGS